MLLERTDMDVKKWLAFISFPLLINCSPEPPKNQGFFKSTVPNCDQQIIQGEYMVRWKDGHVSIEQAKNDSAFINSFMKKNKNQVQFSEPHYRVYQSITEKTVQKKAISATNWGITATSAQEAWAAGYKGQGVTVAIIDSGFDPTHPELQNLLAVNEDDPINGIDDDENGLIDDHTGFDFVKNSGELTDYTGHGTHIAGIIAADHSVGEIQGAAPEVKLLPLSFLEGDGGGTVGAALRAIDYAAERKAQVINASWGGPGCSLTLRDRIKSLSLDNILFVSAAGNEGRSLDDFPEYPAAFTIENQIAVGASTDDGYTAWFSNYGSFVSLVAPGYEINSTYPLKFDTLESEDGKFKPNDGLMYLDGTSMAAPFVAAAAAILWSKKPEASYSEIKKALIDGVTAGNFPVAARGQLDIVRSLELLDEPAENPEPN